MYISLSYLYLHTQHKHMYIYAYIQTWCEYQDCRELLPGQEETRPIAACWRFRRWHSSRYSSRVVGPPTCGGERGRVPRCAIQTPAMSCLLSWASAGCRPGREPRRCTCQYANSRGKLLPLQHDSAGCARSVVLCGFMTRAVRGSPTCHVTPKWRVAQRQVAVLLPLRCPRPGRNRHVACEQDAVAGRLRSKSRSSS